MFSDKIRRAVVIVAVVMGLTIAVVLVPGFTTEEPEETLKEEEENEYYAVYLDEEFLGYTISPGEIQDVTDEYLWSQQSRSEFQVSPKQQLRMEKWSRSTPPSATPVPQLAREIQDRLTFVTRAAGIEIDGEVAVILRNEEGAESVLQRVKENYIDSLEADDKTEVLASEFAQNIRLVSMPADPDSLMAEGEAAEILMRGTDRTEVHQVQQGETAWGIAQAADLSMADLEKANPVEDLSRLHPGDEVELVVADPYVTINSEEEYWYIRHVPHAVETRHDDDMWPWERRVVQAGSPGEIRVTVRIHREDGREVSRETIDEEQLSEPVTHIVVTGTKAVPQYGSGRFILPASGQLTSGFGWRRTGFHSGIDLAMPIGTPVKAADCGMVTSAGSSGAYGIKIKIDHGEGEYVTVYAHLSRLAVSTGDVVEQGQVIGYSGNTGRSTGPHLHFEIHVNGEPQNPLNFFQD